MKKNIIIGFLALTVAIIGIWFIVPHKASDNTNISPIIISDRNFLIVSIENPDKTHYITIVPPVRDNISDVAVIKDGNIAHVVYGVSHISHTYIYDTQIDISDATVAQTSTLLEAEGGVFRGTVTFHTVEKGIWSTVDTGNEYFVIFIDKHGNIAFDSRNTWPSKHVINLTCVGSGISVNENNAWIALGDNNTADTLAYISPDGNVMAKVSITFTDMKKVPEGILIYKTDKQIAYINTQGQTLWTSKDIGENTYIPGSTVADTCKVSSNFIGINDKIFAIYVDGKGNPHGIIVNSSGKEIWHNKLIDINPSVKPQETHVILTSSQSEVSWKLFVGSTGSEIALGTIAIGNNIDPKSSQLVAAAYTDKRNNMYAYLPERAIIKLGKGYINYDLYSPSAHLLGIFYEDTNFEKTYLMTINTTTEERTATVLLNRGDGVYDISTSHIIKGPFFASIGDEDIILFSQTFNPIWKASDVYSYRLANERSDGLKSIINNNHAIVIWKAPDGYILANVNKTGKIDKTVKLSNIEMLTDTGKYFISAYNTGSLHYRIIDRNTLQDIWTETQLSNLSKVLIYSGGGTPYTVVKNTLIFAYAGKDNKAHIAAVDGGRVLWDKVVYNNTDVQAIVYTDDGDTTLNYTIYTPYGDILKTGKLLILPDGRLRE